MPSASRARIVAIDAGTTGVRALLFAAAAPGGATEDGSVALEAVSYRELTQHFPAPGLVEHDPAEIWAHVRDTVTEVAAAAGGPVAAIGITNQRETVVAWNRSTGRVAHPAIVWQDRRTAPACAKLSEAGHLPLVRERTGLVLDPYFSATKMAWLLTDGGVAASGDLVLGTVDTWVLWNLTGATAGGVVATDPTNASRTLLYDIVDRRWSPQLCDVFGVPVEALPQVRPSCGHFGAVAAGALGGGLTGVPVAGIAGDQQASLFGQACFSPGMAKTTYGTGSFLLANAGDRCPPPVDGLLTTVAWDLGDRAAGPQGFAYALEGSIFATGAAIQWLRDGLGIISDAAQIGPLAASADDSGGVAFVPAFTGLGSPWWDPHARGTIVGLSRGTGAAHLARAAIEAIAYQNRDVVDAMIAGGGPRLAELRVDGGVAVVDVLLQLQADQLGVPVTRARSTEATALGAAQLAGLATDVWSSVDDLAMSWAPGERFEPASSRLAADRRHASWIAAVDRARSWSPEGVPATG